MAWRTRGATILGVRAVLFDIDGTLIDSVDAHARSWQESLAAFGVERTFEEVRAQIGKGGDLLMRALVPADRLAQIEGELDADRARRFRALYLPHVVGFPGVPELFRRLREDGVAIALASSARGEELATYQEIAGVRGLVDVAITSDDAARSKPYPDIFLAAYDALGRPPRGETRVVGDSPYDAEAAGRAGLPAIGVLCGGFDEVALRRAGCRAVYRDPAEILVRYGDL